MKPNKLPLLALAILLIGCAGTNALKDSFRDKRSTLGYLHDGKPGLSGSVTVKAYHSVAELPEENEVTRQKSLVVPLLVFNYWKHDFRVDLGETGADASPLKFGKTSLTADLKRSGLNVGDTGGNIKVSVRVNSLKSGTTYYKSGHILFVLVAYQISMGQGSRGIESSLDADIFIERNGKTDSVHYAHVEYASIPARETKQNLPQVIVNAMVETLSLCFKDMNKTIVAEIKQRGG
ncbi:MAG: hypothetical protein K0Q91_403 [Fibrobacteria bacterium]|jgi:hypothetical protein|nr:hypothetical protein [Fibrobacteria bacterium]